MGKKDEVQEKLKELRFYRGVVVALLIANLTWIITEGQNSTLLFYSFIFSLFLFVILIIQSIKIAKKIKEIKDL